MLLNKLFRFIIIFGLLSGLQSALWAEDNNSVSMQDLFSELAQKDEWIQNGDIILDNDSMIANIGTNLANNIPDFGVEQAILCSFYSSRDSIPISLILFDLPSQVEAFGLYCLEKSPSMYFYNIGYETYAVRLKLVTWYGEYVLYTETSDTLENSIKNMRQLADDFVNLLPDQKRATPILESLPGKNRVEHSEKFYRKYWLGQDFFQNIYYADYYTQNGYSRIFIINNIKTAVADSNFWNYQDFINKNTNVIYDTLEIDTDYFVVDEPLWGRTVLAKKNQIIYGILDYHDKGWTEDRLADILDALKKRKIVKPG